jgi:hypothetical protein
MSRELENKCVAFRRLGTRVKRRKRIVIYYVIRVDGSKGGSVYQPIAR